MRTQRSLFLNSNRSFTLVEMVMAITLMGIMLGAIVPSFRPFMDKATLKNTASSVAYILRYARSTAIQRSVNVKLVFPEGNGILVFSVEADPENGAGIYQEEKLPVSMPTELKDKVKISSITQCTLSGLQPTQEISFNPNGCTSDTMITLTDKYEKIYTIGIVGITGQVMVWDHAVETFYDS